MATMSPWSRGPQSLRSMRMLSFALGCSVLFSSVGCHYWQAEPTFPERPAKHAEDVRVTLRDGSRLYLEDVRIEGDSLVGTATAPDWSSGRRAVALADIQRVEGRWLHPGRTGGLIFGVVALVALGFGIVVAASMGTMCCSSL